ncbi:hypothetical protein BH11BAC2_BH11BAC2_18740 [soil metagenome]
MKMKSQIYSVLMILLSYQLPAQHTNILISTNNDPNEPSICINPKNTNELVAASNIANYYYSTDAGTTWNEGTLSSTFGVWGDPCIAVDTLGDFYFFHLSNPNIGSWIDRIVCQKTNSPGGTWTNGTYTGLNGTKAQDKHWVAVDRNSNILYTTWTQFDSYGSSLQTDSSVILFSKSLDQGTTWSTPLRISDVAGDCIDSDDTDEGAVPAVGPNGEVYVSWAGPQGLMFDKSLDGGLTWLPSDIFVSSIPGGWDFAIPGIYRANGLPITACDLSGGPHNGTIYINWSDQRNGTFDTDIWLAKSTDGGATWTNPIRVNDDAGTKEQFFTWMTIDQVTGYLYFVFYDRRNYTSSETDVYMAVSKDGGTSFQNFKISQTPFTPNAGVFFGDYTNVTAHNNVVRPIWTRLDGTSLSVWTALVNTTLLGVDQQESGPGALEQNYPNPFNNETAICYKLRKSSIVTLKIYDQTGRMVKLLLNNESVAAGKHIEKVTAQELGLEPGLYQYELLINGKAQRKPMLLMEK